MNRTELQAALEDMAQQQRIGDDCAYTAAQLMVGRLRKVNSATTLTALKKELKNYNIHTNTWNTK